MFSVLILFYMKEKILRENRQTRHQERQEDEEDEDDEVFGQKEC